jgi:ABC-2 type transport system ATP-binding protein
VVGTLLSSLPVTDLTVEEPPLEEIMSELFRGTRTGGAS